MDFIPFTFIDFIDIFFVAMLMFGLYRMMRGTNAPYILAGIIVVYIVWVVVRALNMELLSSILGQIVSVGVIAILIIFQPELRKFLQMIGMRRKRFNFINRIFNTRDTVDTNLSPIVSACSDMSESKTGALIVIAQESDLRDIIDGGIKLDAQLSVPLLENIFFKNAPLHDGAAIVMNNRIVAAKCILPVTRSNVPKSYGTRHRAAIGITETSDAIVVVVSEETGGVSVAFGGRIERNIALKNLTRAISQHFVNADTEKERKQKKGKDNRNSDGKASQPTVRNAADGGTDAADGKAPAARRSENATHGENASAQEVLHRNAAAEPETARSTEPTRQTDRTGHAETTCATDAAPTSAPVPQTDQHSKNGQ